MPYQRPGNPKMAFVGSYPKSGNTWIRLCCAAYAMGRAADLQKFVEYDDIGVFEYQSVSPIPTTQLGLDAEALLRPSAMLVLSRKIENVTLVKTHHACTEVNGIPLFHPEWTRCVVNPVRDPRDVCCSVKDHFGMSYDEAVEFMDYGQSHIGGANGKCHHVLGTWSDHVGSWMRTDRVPVHTVRYEDMLDDPMTEFREILEFLGADEHVDADGIEEDRLEMAVEGTKFEKMQEAEEEHGFPERSQHQEKFFRKGKHGGWREELTDDQARTIEEDHGEMMEKLGYEFEFV